MDTKECYHCGSLMIKLGTGAVLMTYPPQYPQEWRCGCGHRENAGVIMGKTDEQIFQEEWRALNGL